MTLDIVFSCWTIILGVVIFLWALATDEAVSLASLFGTCLVIAGLVWLVDAISPDKPTALDVYRGNTTLEITYRDSIPVDTVVVFKK